MIWVAAAMAGVLRDQPPPAGLDGAFAPRRIALVVGIDHYDDPALGDLRFAAKDASDLSAVLRDGTVGAYDQVSTEAGAVTREAFWSALRAVSAGVQRDDTVLVYVAAHGTLQFGPQGTELLLLPSDGWLADPSTSIRVGELAEAIETLPAHRKVLVLDACHAGTGRSVLLPEVREQIDRFRGPIPAPPALTVSAFSAHLYSAHVHQPAIEDPGLQNGVYTHYLIEALRGQGDLDGDGLVEVMEAHGWARDRTLEHTGGIQVPWAEVVSVGRASVFLAGDPTRRRASEQAILAGLEALPATAEVRVDGLVRGDGALQHGVRQLEVLDHGETLLQATVRVEAGDRVQLDELVASRTEQLQGTVGLGLSTDRQWLGVGSLLLGVQALPQDPSGARLAAGLLARMGTGPSRAPGGPFVSGSVEATLGPAWSPPWRGSSWSLGPSVGLGALWRLAPAGPQGAPLLSAGGRASVERDRWLLVFDGRLPAFPADGRFVFTPWMAVSTGLRW
jgi:hypothetical protein